MARKLRVGILFGGRSAEHEVSLQSAQNIISAADPRKYEIIPIGITKQGQWRMALPRDAFGKGAALKTVLNRGREVLPAAGPQRGAQLVPVPGSGAKGSIGRLDVIFPVLHGTFGEDGTIQGLLELAGIPYVGAGVLGSAVGMDKEVMKRLFRERGLPIVPYLVVHRSDFETAPRRTCQAIENQAIEKKFRYPVFVKPANLGSSVGISKAGNRRELVRALETATAYDCKVLVERAIRGREIECAVLGNDNPIASVPGEIVPGGEFYDYQAKYLEDTARLIVPAPLRPAQTKQIQRLAVEAFQAAECSGMARVDFFL